MASGTDKARKNVSSQVKDAMERDDWAEVARILSECSSRDSDSIMAQLVSRDQWDAVKQVIRCFGDEERTWDIDGVLVKNTILLTVATGNWWKMRKMPHERFLSSTLEWILQQVCTRAQESDIEYILPHCEDDQLDYVLTTLVKRSRWRAVREVFNRGVSDFVKRWAVLEACQHCCTDNVCDYARLHDILSHCADDQLDSVLPTLVERRLWRAVVNMLTRGVSDSVKRWAVDEACQHYCNVEPLIYWKGYTYCHNNDLYAILLHCADDQLDSVLPTLVKRRLWRDVGQMLDRGVGDSVKRWAVEEACQHCDVSEQHSITQYILPHCADNQLDSVLTTLVKQRLWWAVTEMLERGVSDSVKPRCAVEVLKKLGVSDSLKRWAVKEACVASDDYIIAKCILPHCPDDQLDSVLTTLVERRKWEAVIEVLKRGVSDSVNRWAVKESCVASNQNIITQNILPPCADDQLDSVLITLVERRLWGAVEMVFKQDVSDSVKLWAVVEVCHYYEQSNIDDQLDSVLITLVKRSLWLSLQNVLKRAASDLNKDLAGQKTCEHCRSAGVYFSEHRVHDSDSPVHNRFTQHCEEGNLDSPSSALTKRDECTAVRNMSGPQVSDAQRRTNIKAAFRCADENTVIESILPYYVYDSIHSALKKLALRGFWSAFLVLLHNCIIDTFYMWAVAKDTESKDQVFWDMARNPCDGVKGLTPAMWRSVTWSRLQRSLKQLLDWDTPLCEVLCESLLAIVKEVWLSGRSWQTCTEDHTAMERAFSIVDDLHKQVKSFLTEGSTCRVSVLLPCLEGMQNEYTQCGSEKSIFLQLCFVRVLVLQYYKRKAWEQMTNAILVVLTTVPVVPDVQSVALRVMLRHKRWDVIKHACLSGVCEQDRRQLFQAAVKQREWSAVKRWADHTLYDDQRLWALGEARQEKRWDVYLKLADHGLSEWERVGVLFRVTMHADWKLVRHMLRKVADVTDTIDLLTKTPGTLSKLGAKNYYQRMDDMKTFEKTVSTVTKTMRTLKTMAKRQKWWVVLHNIRHKPNLQHARRALKAAVSSDAWHAVMQLVRLETDVTRRDSLFGDMVRLRQWAVCRELLEQGVSHQLCLELLSELIEHSQWTLVAMVMECPMADERRNKILQQAIRVREGSVVWQCINNLQTRLCVKKREHMFQLSFNREVWQAVKPLIEEKDETGIIHRDTALLEAIEQHQWDVVDHCQRHHADINMKDDDGQTPIHRAARKGDWETVKELTVRDGDPNLLDSEGLSVLHRAVEAEQWDLVKLLIQFHGDIHLAKRNRSTPLQMLIDARQGEVIESSLMWCPDQQKVANSNRETVLHAVCLSGWHSALHHLIARKVDPLGVTNEGHTALCYAVLCKDCPQRMVAECITLGFSTHQPHITDTALSHWSSNWRLRYNCVYPLTYEDTRLLMSPLVLAVMRGLPVVTQMLYESGACSNRHLFKMNAHQADLLEQTSRTRQKIKGALGKLWQYVYSDGGPSYSFNSDSMQQSAKYLREMCSTPRSLVSTCRLVISRCLTLSKTRHRDIAQLPLSPKMKSYLMFSDLTDPRYPDLFYGK